MEGISFQGGGRLVKNARGRKKLVANVLFTNTQAIQSNDQSEAYD